jgi:hypothetical protein
MGISPMRFLEWDKLRAFLFPPAAQPVDAGDRGEYERFAIPHTFKPSLSFADALVAVAGAFLRIFLGSLLFAVWGTYTMFAWSRIGNYFLKVLMAAPMILLFLLSFGLLMRAIAAMVRTLSPRHR